MGIVDFNSNSRNMPFGQQTAPNGEERPKADTWLNVGYVAAGQFINLPMGLPIDTMKEAKVNGQNEDWVKRRKAQNDFLRMIQELGAKLAPGQEQVLNLQVRLRRVHQELDVTKDENEYGIDLASLIVAAE
jgi:hypothetical protein